jgi:hypothetical protein
MLLAFSRILGLSRGFRARFVARLAMGMEKAEAMRSPSKTEMTEGVGN